MYDKLDYQWLETVGKEYGDNYYLLDEALFGSNYDRMLSAFRSYYPHTEIAYSYKTNYLPVLCRIVKDKGGNSEIVSEMELYLAQKLGVPGKRIYYNGPWKKTDCVETFMLAGGHVNIDGFYEIRMIEEIAKKHPQEQFFVGLRIAGDIGQDESCRFGFDAENKDLLKAFKTIDDIPNVFVSGLHLHLPFRMPDTFKARMKVLSDILEEFPDHRFDYISLGGGYMGQIPDDMRGEFSFEPPTYDDYAKIVAGSFSEMAAKYTALQDTKLIIEPGSALVADTMKLVTRVINIKESRGRKIATLSGSTFQMNPSVKNVKRSIKVYSEADKEDTSETVKNAQNINIDMGGYTCIEGDYLYRNYSGNLSEGDFVVFDNVGSYSVVMKPPFILPDVPVVSISGEQTERITRPQTAEDVFTRLFNF